MLYREDGDRYSDLLKKFHQQVGARPKDGDNLSGGLRGRS
nr:hypothetical protein [uncultured Albidiferax sp.]